MTHTDYLPLGEKWLLKDKGCSFVLTELFAAGANGEIPDLLGFRVGAEISILVEVKTSRSDFFADFQKPFRRRPELGLGSYRFYLCPEGIIMPEDLPDRWGLLWVTPEETIVQQVGPEGNIWGQGSPAADAYMFDEKDLQGEWGMMGSALRRMQKRGVLEQVKD